MRFDFFAFLSGLITGGFGRDNNTKKFVITVLLISITQALLVTAGAYIDETLNIDDEMSVGLLEHYGIMTILVTDPMLILSASYAHYRFLAAFHKLPVSRKVNMDDILRDHLERLSMKGRARFFYFLLFFIGLIAWVNNINQTIEPIQYYGNNVFDSKQYWHGFLANKLNLFVSWVVVYPLSFFFIIFLGLSTWQILKEL
ncbi:MAG: hypothetical protein CMI12_00220, partial [Oceanospirillum sp.]|nr:hypothetical protein [Oceanospirillum sp.]